MSCNLGGNVAFLHRVTWAGISYFNRSIPNYVKQWLTEQIHIVYVLETFQLSVLPFGCDSGIITIYAIRTDNSCKHINMPLSPSGVVDRQSSVQVRMGACDYTVVGIKYNVYCRVRCGRTTNERRVCSLRWALLAICVSVALLHVGARPPKPPLPPPPELSRIIVVIVVHRAPRGADATPQHARKRTTRTTRGNCWLCGNFINSVALHNASVCDLLCWVRFSNGSRRVALMKYSWDISFNCYSPFHTICSHGKQIIIGDENMIDYCSFPSIPSANHCTTHSL